MTELYIHTSPPPPPPPFELSVSGVSSGICGLTPEALEKCSKRLAVLQLGLEESQRILATTDWASRSQNPEELDRLARMRFRTSECLDHVQQLSALLLLTPQFSSQDGVNTMESLGHSREVSVRFEDENDTGEYPHNEVLADFISGLGQPSPLQCFELIHQSTRHYFHLAERLLTERLDPRLLARRRSTAVGGVGNAKRGGCGFPIPAEKNRDSEYIKSQTTTSSPTKRNMEVLLEQSVEEWVRWTSDGCHFTATENGVQMLTSDQELVHQSSAAILDPKEEQLHSGDLRRLTKSIVGHFSRHLTLLGNMLRTPLPNPSESQLPLASSLSSSTLSSSGQFLRGSAFRNPSPPSARPNDNSSSIKSSSIARPSLSRDDVSSLMVVQPVAPMGCSPQRQRDRTFSRSNSPPSSPVTVGNNGSPPTEPNFHFPFSPSGLPPRHRANRTTRLQSLATSSGNLASTSPSPKLQPATVAPQLLSPASPFIPVGVVSPPLPPTSPPGRPRLQNSFSNPNFGGGFRQSSPPRMSLGGGGLLAPTPGAVHKDFSPIMAPLRPVLDTPAPHC